MTIAALVALAALALWLFGTGLATAVLIDARRRRHARTLAHRLDTLPREDH